MRRKKVIALILSACLVLSLVVWKGTSMLKTFLNGEKQQVPTLIESPEDDQSLRNTVLYYKDDKGYLVPVMRKIPWPEGRGIAKASMRALVDNTANRSDMETLGLAPILPANTEIIGMSINNGLCKVNLTEEFQNYGSKEEEMAIVKSVVYTLTEFPTVEEVQIMIEGESPNALTYGLDVSRPLARKDINYSGSGEDKSKVIVYYQGTVNGMENYFVPVTKDVEIAENESVTVIRTLETLIEGPSDESGLFSVIPSSLQIRNVDVLDGVAYIDFSEEIKEIEDESIAQDMIKSIALTLKEYYKNDVLVEKVSIMANGKEIDFGEGTKEEPIAVPTFANEY
ncbi:GerMN domain-containing protein [Maledivibacter halophilus]|uniref:Germination protein M n=1 Tax=Maledivibacter halophilus TaxID=36842 RepID=A0A1T5MX94_9FIRM|nr:GerMN domain-containing protein [Maledivibacter halophilus]SKC92488.1 germination protein M [Maledivibacter halophilus]